MVQQHEKLHHNVEGIEVQLTGNHLGIFLLVSLLPTRLRQSSPGARIVAVSSVAHALGLFRWDNPNYELHPDKYGTACHPPPLPRETR